VVRENCLIGYAVSSTKNATFESCPLGRVLDEEEGKHNCLVSNNFGPEVQFNEREAR